MSKIKGIRGERDLIRMFWSAGWAAIRSAGSGSQSYPSPDLLVGNKSRRLAIEAKVTKEDRKYFSHADVRQLTAFSEYFGAESWFAIKFLKNDWVFFSPEDLDQTDGSYVASVELADRKGLSFEELTGN
jgi:Holliday junction resolvase